MRLLLISNSTTAGQPYLQWPLEHRHFPEVIEQDIKSLFETTGSNRKPA